MRKPLLIIASCTDRKRLPPAGTLRLRKYQEGTVEPRFKSWWSAIRSCESGTLRADRLYLGDHWAVVRDLPVIAQTAGWNAQVWIASAGYGLVPAAAPLHSYAATFSRGHRDAVVRSTTRDGRVEARIWWSLLGSVIGPVRKAPRRIADLLESHPRAHVLVVGSETYVRALEDDLLEVVRLLKGRDGLLLVTGSHVGLKSELERACIPSLAKLTHHLGGSLIGLHARLARWILEDAPKTGLEAEGVRNAVQRLITRTPTRESFDRRKMTDHEVSRFIERTLRQDATLPQTVLLRRLRDSGRACEQARFRGLLAQVRRNG